MNASINTGKTQSFARCLNNRLVMRILRENGAASSTMLAERLNLSNAALTAIIGELKTNGYIKEHDDVNAKIKTGRPPRLWTVNADYGCIVVISLSDYVARVVVSDMNMHIKDSMETRIEKYDISMLYELALTVKNILSSDTYRDIPLKWLEFSMPGRVDMLSGELQLSSQFDKDIFSEKNFIVNLFERQFGVPVVLDNDINLAALGEMHCGLLKGIGNGMIVHIDEGIGGALIFGEKLYTGSRGFAGELGLMHTRFGNEVGMLDEFVSVRAISEKLCADGGDVFELFCRDEAARKYVLDTSRCLGRVLKDLVEVLDINTIVLSGGVSNFGDEYLNVLNEEVSHSINGARVYPSRLGRDASIHGAIYKAVETLTDDIFK